MDMAITQSSKTSKAVDKLNLLRQIVMVVALFWAKEQDIPSSNSGQALQFVSFFLPFFLHVTPSLFTHSSNMELRINTELFVRQNPGLKDLYRVYTRPKVVIDLN